MTPEEANKILFGAVLVTKLEIRKAYKVLALIYHPDKVRRAFSSLGCALDLYRIHWVLQNSQKFNSVMMC